MSAVLATLLEQGWLAPVDVHLARTLAAIGGESDEEVLLAAALASRQVRMGDTCLQVGDALLGDRLRDELGRSLPMALPEPARWRERLLGSALVGGGEAARPLVLEADGRLYLYRYWQHEGRIAEQLRQRAAAAEEAPDPRWLRARLDALFGEPGAEVDWQRVAATVALLRRLCVISGGPGTGKTFTVAKILALLVELSLLRGERLPRIALLAPTGKAAARLAESIKQAKLQLPVASEVCNAIGEEASTIHRALGSASAGGGRFRHGRDDPLPADVVLVDEASMVDVALMASLVEALPRRARLVLLGDRDQLASVDAGAVLGDICNSGQAPSYSAVMRELVERYSGQSIPGSSPQGGGLWDSIVQLRRSYRFGEHSGIAMLARAVNAGDGEEAVRVLQSPEVGEVRLEPPGQGGALPQALLRRAVAHYGVCLQHDDAAAALAGLDELRLLCALRRGPHGVERVNDVVERQLAATGAIAVSRRFYRGRPLMVTRNDYAQQLFNGDVGVALGGGEAGVRVCFVAPDGSLRRVAPSWLPPHETVYAMTVHKSQGSEFGSVMLLLPPVPTPLLTRELIYTAVTRARSEVVVHGTLPVVRAAVGRRLERQSGLRARLWG